MTQDKDGYSHKKLTEYQNRYKNPKLDAQTEKALSTWNELKTWPFPLPLVVLPLYFMFDLVRFVLGGIKRILF
jgi:hypothetical protein